MTVAYDKIGRTFNRSEATRAAELDISKAFNRVWNTGLLCIHNSYGISAHVFSLNFFFLLIDSSQWFWIGSFCRNIQLKLVFLKAPFSLLHFSYYTSMTFLMISVILLSMLMILLSTLNVIKHLICGNN